MSDESCGSLLNFNRNVCMTQVDVVLKKTTGKKKYMMVDFRGLSVLFGKVRNHVSK